MQDLAIIYITTPSLEKAQEISTHLLHKKLIACSNIITPMQSMYWWQGAICNDTECILIVKTVDSLYEKVKQEVEQIHPYDVPCIIKINAVANKSYAAWIQQITQQ